MSNNSNMPLKVAAYLKGVGITKVTLDDKNNLIFTMSNGKEENVGALNVDDALSDESRNPVQNMILTQIINAIRSELSRIDTESKGRDDNGKQYTDGAVGAVIRQLNEHIATFQGFLDYANPQLARVESGSVVTDNTSQRVIRGSNKPVSGDAVYQSLNGKVDKVDGKGLSANDYTTEEKAKVAKIEGKQDTLTLTVKDNGNIVIGNIAGQTKEFMAATPSGDPMHYAYEAAGALWNATESTITRTAPWGGESVSHLPNCWYLNGLGDIDNKEMRRIYTLGACIFSGPALAYGGVDGSYDSSVIGSVRTNISRLGWYNATVTTSGIAYYNRKIVVVNMCIYPSRDEGIITMTGDGDFFNCQALRVVNGKIRFTKLSKTNFQQCYSLQQLKIVGLANNLYLGDSKALSKVSLLYMIKQSAATSPIVITLHADVYAWASIDSDVQTALAAKPNVTIASV